MTNGIRKGLDDIAKELKGIKLILSAMWQKRYATGETDVIAPDVYTDEFISSEEAGRRLGVTDQTIRNWCAMGKKDPSKGWQEGIHYINISPEPKKRAIIRVPWNALVQSFAKNRRTVEDDSRKSIKPMYQQREYDDGLSI